MADDVGNGIFDLFPPVGGVSSWKGSSLEIELPRYLKQLGFPRISESGLADFIQIICPVLRPDPKTEKKKIRKKGNTYHSLRVQFEHRHDNYAKEIDRRVALIQKMFERVPEYTEMSALGYENLMASLREFETFGGLIPDHPQIFGDDFKVPEHSEGLITTPWELFDYEKFPTSRQYIKMVMVCWLRKHPNDFDGYRLGQTAKPINSLKITHGFRWKSDGNGEDTFREPGDSTDYRMIVGIDFNAHILDKSGTITKKASRDFVTGRRCVFCGSTRSLQPDHRIPGVVYTAGFLSGDFPELRYPHKDHKDYNNTHFQVVCLSCNYRKRERCGPCVRGAPIDPPRILIPFKGFFIREIGEAEDKGNPCKGCMWYNPLEPLHKPER